MKSLSEMKTTALSLAAGLALSGVAYAQNTLPEAMHQALGEPAAHPHTAEPSSVLSPLNQGVVPFLVSIGVFIIVFAILAKTVWPKILGGLKDRENKIREEIEAAEMARQQAKDALEQYQQSLAQARAEAQKMIETTKAQQAVLAGELRAKAEAELAQLRERAMKDIDTAKRAAVSEIYAHSTSLATAVASKILRRNITPEDTQRLVEESLQQLQTSKS